MANCKIKAFGFFFLLRGQIKELLQGRQKVGLQKSKANFSQICTESNVVDSTVGIQSSLLQIDKKICSCILNY